MKRRNFVMAMLGVSMLPVAVKAADSNGPAVKSGAGHSAGWSVRSRDGKFEINPDQFVVTS